ncbi:MAG: sigma-70 family RNA polymerase sigma factor [Planctomycetes bacterium]|nr:sigma-70 family RNA polymerase sigma factor [Planctomycetota bacterium]
MSGTARRLIDTIDAGGDAARQAAADLLPLVYDELRALARARLAREGAPQTLQATALVHEAWLRLVGPEDPGWKGRGHFFGAAARAMRHVLVDRARARGRDKRGGGAQRVTLDAAAVVSAEPDGDVLALDEALTRLEAHDPRKAEVVLLRHFAGLELDETAAALGVSASTVKADWAYARAWLLRELERGTHDPRASG